MKHLKRFEQYDSPDVPKLSDKEIKDMTNIRRYHNKVQKGFYHKGSADINTAFADLLDQEKQDILTVFGMMADKYFTDLDILKRDADFNYYRKGTTHLRYRLNKEIKTENSGNVQIRIEIGFKHWFTSEIWNKEDPSDDINDLNQYKNKNDIYIYCSAQSFYDKKKEDREMLKIVMRDDKIKPDECVTGCDKNAPALGKEEMMRVFNTGDEDYTKEELEIHKQEDKFNKKNFHFNKENISNEEMEKYIKRYAKVYDNFKNYLYSKYDIKVKDLK